MSWRRVEERYRSSLGQFSEAIGLEISKELNRHLLNYLTTFRTFVDHWKTALRRRARSTGSVHWLTTFEKKLEKFLSRCFEFQFFWDYRNYVQHVGLPNLDLIFRSALTTGETPGLLHFGSVGFDRDALTKSYDWKHAKRSLPNQPAHIELFARVSVLARCLEQLNSVCTKQTFPEFGHRFICSRAYVGRLTQQSRAQCRGLLTFGILALKNSI